MDVGRHQRAAFAVASNRTNTAGTELNAQGNRSAPGSHSRVQADPALPTNGGPGRPHGRDKVCAHADLSTPLRAFPDSASGANERHAGDRRHSVVCADIAPDAPLHGIAADGEGTKGSEDAVVSGTNDDSSSTHFKSDMNSSFTLVGLVKIQVPIPEEPLLVQAPAKTSVIDVRQVRRDAVADRRIRNGIRRRIAGLSRAGINFEGQQLGQRRILDALGQRLIELGLRAELVRLRRAAAVLVQDLPDTHRAVLLHFAAQASGALAAVRHVLNRKLRGADAGDPVLVGVAVPHLNRGEGHGVQASGEESLADHAIDNLARVVDHGRGSLEAAHLPEGGITLLVRADVRARGELQRLLELLRDGRAEVVEGRGARGTGHVAAVRPGVAAQKEGNEEEGEENERTGHGGLLDVGTRNFFVCPGVDSVWSVFALRFFICGCCLMCP